jgi:hypothetical protein
MLAGWPIVRILDASAWGKRRGLRSDWFLGGGIKGNNRKLVSAYEYWRFLFEFQLESSDLCGNVMEVNTTHTNPLKTTG